MADKRERLGADPLSWIGDSRKGRPVGSTATRPNHASRHVDVLNMGDRPISGLIADYFACGNCRFVGRARGGDAAKLNCAHCGNDLSAASFHFGRSVHSLVNLVQASYQSTLVQPKLSPVSASDHALATGILFTQFYRCIMEHFLRDLMREMRMPPTVANRLLADHMDVRDRTSAVFGSLTGQRWDTVIAEVAADTGADLQATLHVVEETILACDEYLNSRGRHELRPSAPESCLRHMQPLLDLFVSLHNRYVPELHRIGRKGSEGFRLTPNPSTAGTKETPSAGT